MNNTKKRQFFGPFARHPYNFKHEFHPTTCLAAFFICQIVVALHRVYRPTPLAATLAIAGLIVILAAHTPIWRASLVQRFPSLLLTVHILALILLALGR